MISQTQTSTTISITIATTIRILKDIFRSK
jgi:hypothetical protein